MSTVAVTRVVGVPVARVWTVFTDLPARAAWLATVDGVEVLTSDYRITYTFAPVWPRASAVRRRPSRSCRRSALGATAVTVVLEGTASGSAARLLAFVLGGLAGAGGRGALRQDLTDLAAAAA
jgi:hypothetical protein